jgi:hypothetical protein
MTSEVHRQVIVMTRARKRKLLPALLPCLVPGVQTLEKAVLKRLRFRRIGQSPHGQNVVNCSPGSENTTESAKGAEKIS